MFSSKSLHVIEGSNAKVGQLIAALKYVGFLTPENASKNDARHGIGLSKH